MKICAISNIKGGVGKTTTAVNLSHALSMKGKKVLLIDLDPQCSTSSALGKRDESKNIFRVFKGEYPLLNAMTYIEEIDIAFVSSDWSLGEVEQTSSPNAYYFLKHQLNRLGKEYEVDYILLDCPGSIGTLTQAALIASTHILIPLQTEILNIEALSPYLRVYGQIIEMHNSDLKILGIVPSLFDSRRNIDAVTVEACKETLDIDIFRTKIRRNVKLAESPAKRQTIFQYAPKSHGASDYKKLAKEFLERIK